MSSDVVLTSALRNNLLSLQNTQRLIDTTQLRLATGLKVNSALDNPQSFFAAQSLNNRASDLQRLLDGVNQSIRTIEEADNGVSALTDLINQAESIATEAQSEIRAAEGFARIRGNVDLSGTTDLTDLTGVDANDLFRLQFVDVENGTATTTVNVTIAANNTVDSIVASINSNTNINDSVRASVTSGGQLQIESLEENGILRIIDSAATATQLGAAGFAALGLDTVVGTEATNAGATSVQQAGTSIAGSILRSAAAATASQVNGEFVASATLDAAGYLGATSDSISISLTIDGVQTSLGSVTGTDTIQDVIDLVNTAGLSNVEATFDTDTGRIELEFDSDIGQVELQYNDGGTSTTAFGFGAGAADVALGGNSASEVFTFVGTSANLDQFESDYNNIREQIDTLVEDANYRGVNLLAGDDLETFFNEDRDNTLVTDGVDFTALGLGLDEADFTNGANIQISIDDARAALESVRNFGQSIANDLAIIQTRRDFTEETINTLTAGADDLIVADQNEEGANLLALQTRQALGTTSLSLASQSQQSVLRLF